MRALWLLLVLAIVGCVQASTPAPATTSLPQIQLRECTNASGVFPVPLAEAQAMLPSGFSAVPTGGSPVDGATMDVVVARCESATVDGVDVGGEALVAYAELEVAPPADLHVDGLDDYVAPVFFAASPPALGDAFAALHVGRAGSGTLERTTLPTGALSVTATLGADGFRMTGQTTTSAGSLAAGEFRVFGVQDATLHTVLRGTYTGAHANGAALAIQAIGAPPLIGSAQRPAARGGAVAGFDLGFAEISG